MLDRIFDGISDGTSDRQNLFNQMECLIKLSDKIVGWKEFIQKEFIQSDGMSDGKNLFNRILFLIFQCFVS